ncbi:hypothetical protein [Clostridium beijerinckii]|uniref:Uncharacterized protein n=1 Tax=Clostridium beijerinckii TaxID=1520 RepID=A0A9Q5GJH7_CLOBE|nr:hypothetical protein [Clostridium beijerinckii]AQS04502.1 hypothetical protein CLBIJ_19240 [Clostridium beijerinckii]MBA2887352.1 hypothetical protein [Clostridium beijerinckii]MBA2902251.1 hypothetical protein [Clostridium beijerinckii]MBA2912074.1 hypothetical protein [Clostridium beijerinckii]MBA9015943.1 hypothetical protein [Clostridium beijerinckii]
MKTMWEAYYVKQFTKILGNIAEFLKLDEKFMFIKDRNQYKKC